MSPAPRLLRAFVLLAFCASAAVQAFHGVEHGLGFPPDAASPQVSSDDHDGPSHDGATCSICWASIAPVAVETAPAVPVGPAESAGPAEAVPADEVVPATLELPPSRGPPSA